MTDSLNVMVVDDSRLTIEIVRKMLLQLGHKVVQTATSGPEAIDLYGSCRPHVVTMDLTMPDMDGIVTTHKLLEKFPDARVVMITSHSQQRVVVDALKAGAKSFLVKPFKPERLQAVLQDVMNRSTGPI